MSVADSSDIGSIRSLRQTRLGGIQGFRRRVGRIDRRRSTSDEIVETLRRRAQLRLRLVSAIVLVERCSPVCATALHHDSVRIDVESLKKDVCVKSVSKTRRKKKRVAPNGNLLGTWLIK